MPYTEIMTEKNEVARQSQFWEAGHGRTHFFYDGDLTVDSTNRQRQRARRLHHFALLSVLILSVLHWFFYGWKGGNNIHARLISSEMGPFNWTALNPSKELKWTDCYAKFQCARLTVPLVYSEPSDGEGAVALIKYPSVYPPGHEKYRGPILFNPGGPGGSGVALVAGAAEQFRLIISDEFDLVGFDPRGIGFTTPAMTLFNDQVEVGKFFVQFPASLNSSISALGEAYSRARILGNLVADRTQFVAERVSTPTVARDMLSIVKAFGEEKLQYWGFSYGTVLGATFAAMFPDNVGRVILDGVVDTDNYYKGLWSNNLRDTDAALMDIYQACVIAGPSRCPIYESSPSLVKARIDLLLNKLRSEPLAFYDASTSSYEVLDYAMARQAIFNSLYSPHSIGAFVTRALAALEQGEPAFLYRLTTKIAFNSLLECTCPAGGENPVPATGFYEITCSVACGDAEDRTDDLESLRAAYEDMSKMSSFAETWPLRVFCSGWKLHAKERFNGSLERTTSNPLLLIGNTADPVTPLWNAHKVSKGFKDSIVLTQNSSGHCSISAVSTCTYLAVRGYFMNGTLPESGTTCEVSSSIFGEKEIRMDTLSLEEKELIEAAQTLQKNYFVPVFP